MTIKVLAFALAAYVWAHVPQDPGQVGLGLGEHGPRRELLAKWLLYMYALLTLTVSHSSLPFLV